MKNGEAVRPAKLQSELNALANAILLSTFTKEKEDVMLEDTIAEVKTAVLSKFTQEHMTLDQAFAEVRAVLLSPLNMPIEQATAEVRAYLANEDTTLEEATVNVEDVLLPKEPDGSEMRGLN